MGSDSDSLNMLSIGVNEILFHVSFALFPVLDK